MFVSAERLTSFRAFSTNDNPTISLPDVTDQVPDSLNFYGEIAASETREFQISMYGRYFVIQRTSRGFLTIAEVVVYGCKLSQRKGYREKAKGKVKGKCYTERGLQRKGEGKMNGQVYIKRGLQRKGEVKGEGKGLYRERVTEKE